MDVRGDSLRRRSRLALRPDRPVGPNVGLVNRADGARLNDLGRLAQSRARRALIAHLRLHAGLSGDVGHLAGLVQRMGQRLLAEAVLPHLHGHDRRRRVGMVGGADRDGVNLFIHSNEHVAEIDELFGIGKPLGHKRKQSQTENKVENLFRQQWIIDLKADNTLDN